MKLAGIGLGGISLVFSVHSFGMYAPSIASGWLADRFGRRATVTAGAVTLAAACALAPISERVPLLVLALFLLGLGWNLCFVAGSALLADRLAPAEKGRMQGLNDLLMSSMAAVASLAGGLLFAAEGYAIMGLVGVLASSLLLALVMGLGQAARNGPLGAD
jgi:MFS family permease